MESQEYFALKAERETLKTRLLELNKLINSANRDNIYEPLTYSQLGPAIEYWYEARHYIGAYKGMSAASSICWSTWKEAYDEFITSGKCKFLYVHYVMSGLSYEEAYIRDNNEDPSWSVGGFRYTKPQISKVVFNRANR